MVLRKYIFALLVLFVAILYDVVTSFPMVMHDHGIEELTTTVNDILDKHTRQLLSPSMTNLYSKDQLNMDELNTVKQTLDGLKNEGIYVKIYDGSSLLFWTQGLITEGFCRTFAASPFKGEICYAPFSANGICLLYTSPSPRDS